MNIILAALTVASLVVLTGVKLTEPSLFSLPPVMAQTVRSRAVGQQIYQQLPNLPQENQYVSKETGKVDSENTLVNRLIQYHVYVKGRPPKYRLDWKLTLADYLGVNELMAEKSYPGADVLRTNPIEGDRAAIGRLNRAQRDALVMVLVNVFDPNTTTTSAPAPSTAPQPEATPSPGATSPISPLPRPGDARLLMP